MKSEQPSAPSPVATDWKQPLRLMVLAAFVVVLVLGGIAALAIPRGWLREQDPVNLSTLAVLIVLGVAALITATGARQVWRHTWPALPSQRDAQSKLKRRWLPINGQAVPFGFEDDLVPGINWPLEKVQSAMAWAEKHGLTDGAWTNGPLRESELRQFRMWLNASGLARKSGKARSSAWELDGDMQDVIDLINRI